MKEGIRTTRQSGWRLLIKRAMDVLGAICLLAILGPMLACAAFLSLISMGRPVFFRQPRPGRCQKVFFVIKMRTMSEGRGPDGALLPDPERLTRIGSFLRKTSLDEVPQLFNVLKGEMSLVGPRPLLTQYLGRYTSRQSRRHEVLPGITGVAQVNGRNAISWDEKFELDVWYVENWSLWLDVKILTATVWRVLRRDGINPAGLSYQPEFMGSEKAR